MFRRAILTVALVAAMFGAVDLQAVSPDRLRFQAIQLLRDGHYGDAEPLLENLLEISPSATHVYLLGLCRLKRWRLESAADLLQAATAAEPTRHAWLNTFAECQLERGRCDLAIELLDKAISLRDLPTYRYNRAMCRLNLGEVDAAEKDLVALLRNTPDHTHALVSLAEIMLDSGRYSQAREALAAVPTTDRTEEALFLSARVHVIAGEPVPAEADFEAVLELTPGHTGALFGLGRLLIGEGRDDEGQVVLDRFNSARKKQEEIENLRDHLANHPRDIEVRLRLARCLAEIGNNRECLTELEYARRADPTNPVIYRMMADRFNHTGHLEEARRSRDKAVELEKTNR